VKETHDKIAVATRLRALREEQGLSLRDLASRSGLAVSFLSKIESGKASPTITSLVKLLDALRVDVSDFFATRTGDGDPVVCKRSEMSANPEADRTLWYAFPNRPEHRITLSYGEYQPQSRAHEVERQKGDVCGLVLDGALTLEIPGRGTEVAEMNDAFYIKAGLPHIIRNQGNTLLRMVVAQMKRSVP
jgi:transcriptional regulator with XRE-family HTH domain